MLHHYLSLLKSVQLLLFASGENGGALELGMKWLRRHFQPVEVGLLPASSYKDWGVAVNYPQGSAARVFTELSPDASPEVRDALVLSSCYIAPLMVLGNKGWERLAPYALWVRRTSRLPDENEILRLLHLSANATAQLFPLAREVYHAILDYLHGELQPDALDILAEKRRIQIAQEAERIFNTVPHHEQGSPLVFVADPLRLIAPWLRTMKRTLLAELPWDEFASLGFGFAVGVIVTPENLRRFFRSEQAERRPTHARTPSRNRHR